MEKYESIVIVKPDLTKKQLKEVSEKIVKKIEEVGKLEKMEDMGKKKLAYEINREKEGYYIAYQFKANNDKDKSIAEIERLYRITEEIMKFVVVKVD